MANAKDLRHTDGLSISIIAVPGGGKSHFARSALRMYPGAGHLFVAPAAELNSYAGVDVDYTVLHDPKWRSSENSFVAESYPLLMKTLKELEAKPPKIIVFDTASAGVNEAIWKDIMSGYDTDDPRSLGGNSRQPYVAYAARLTELRDRLDLLRFRHKCHVIWLWHEDIREVEGSGVARKETEGGKTRIVWDVGRLPLLRGGMRQDILKWDDLAFWSDPVMGSNPFRCALRVIPDQTRAVKARLPIVPALQAYGEVPNDFPTLLGIIEKAGAK